MKRKFAIKTVPSTWLEIEGRRLDCGPYMSGAIEARQLLKNLSARKDYLQDLTKNGIAGIVNAGRISRIWVNDHNHGYPFLSSTDILQADLSNVSFIAKSVARQNPQLLIKKHWTLITRSGSIGRMAYARADMDGMACTEDVLRVIPDEDKVLPGYIYAYLSTKFGVPLVTSGTYGSIITHLEPHHIAELPVPRLGDVEDRAHELIQQAADLRTEGAIAFNEAKNIFDSFLNVLPEDKPLCGLAFSTVSSNNLLKRIDAAYHSPSAMRIEETILDQRHITVGEIANVMLPPISSRVMTNDPEYGYPYYSGDALYYWAPEPKGYLAKKSPKIETLIVNDEGILVQAFGQTYGLICRPTWVIPSLVGSAISGLMLRLTASDKRILRYLYAYLASRAGQIVTKRLPYGGSIPHMNETQYREVPVPVFEDQVIDEISEKIQLFIDAKIEGNRLEDEARALVERAIEEGGR